MREVCQPFISMNSSGFARLAPHGQGNFFLGLEMFATTIGW